MTKADPLTIDMDAMQRHRDETTMRYALQQFFDRWSPEDPRDKSEFQVEFSMLQQRIYMAASEPFRKALTDAMIRSPFPPTIFSTK